MACVRRLTPSTRVRRPKTPSPRVAKRTPFPDRVELPQLEADRDRRQIARTVVGHVNDLEERTVLDAAQRPQAIIVQLQVLEGGAVRRYFFALRY